MTYNPYVATAPTLDTLFNAYVSHLKNRNATCSEHMEAILRNASSHIGGAIPVSNVTTESICSWLGSIYARGSVAMADRARAYLKACFNWGMSIKFDYRNPNAVNWQIKNNPVLAIPSDRGASSKARSRFLDRNELDRFVAHLQNDMGNVSARVLMFCLSIGSRIEEGACLKVNMYEPSTGIVRWETTKTKKPHQVALGTRMRSLMNEWIVGKESDEFIFPSSKDNSKPVSSNTILKYFGRIGFGEDVTPRDACRRTFKSMGQVANIDLTMLDLIQQHASDRSISTLHYNRYSLTEEAMERMRMALNQWEEWLYGNNKVKAVA